MHCLSPRERLVDLIARAYVRGGTPADDARHLAEWFLADRNRLISLQRSLVALAGGAGIDLVEDRRS